MLTDINRLAENTQQHMNLALKIESKSRHGEFLESDIASEIDRL